MLPAIEVFQLVAESCKLCAKPFLIQIDEMRLELVLISSNCIRRDLLRLSSNVVNIGIASFPSKLSIHFEHAGPEVEVEGLAHVAYGWLRIIDKIFVSDGQVAALIALRMLLGEALTISDIDQYARSVSSTSQSSDRKRQHPEGLESTAPFWLLDTR